MQQVKVPVMLEEGLLIRLDTAIRAAGYTCREDLIQAALREKLDRLGNEEYLLELEKLDQAEEQQFSDEGLATDASEWPRY